MIAVKALDVRTNFKELCDFALSGETVLVSRPRNQNVALVSAARLAEIERMERNEQYLAKLEMGRKELDEGKGIKKTMTELRAMER
ncbi:MAG: type II toxin-antitoxin system Phd/YefM family antitoxin [Clostridiales Family XIII bacterium]|jgi:antitoxin YefM|nr:type II toxin-antitoxin system Phd/YefM family antitoxin [Clostridiales Family XIII bacterium]